MSGGIVANCTIRSNQTLTASYGGGGIDVLSGVVTVMNCIIEYHTVSNYGGGINVEGCTSTKIRNCLIRNNKAQNGGGLHISVANVSVANCTIVGNYAGTVGGGINFANFSDSAHTNTIVNCIIFNNTSGSWGLDNLNDTGNPKHYYALGYCCTTQLSYNIQVDTSGRGNIANKAPSFINYAGGNYRFNRTSPCFNSGTNQTDWMNSVVDLAGYSRVRFGRVDMGAYEWYPRIKVNGVAYENIRFINGVETYRINGTQGIQ